MLVWLSVRVSFRLGAFLLDLEDFGEDIADFGDPDVSLDVGRDFAVAEERVKRSVGGHCTAEESQVVVLPHRRLVEESPMVANLQFYLLCRPSISGALFKKQAILSDRLIALSPSLSLSPTSPIGIAKHRLL